MEQIKITNASKAVTEWLKAADPSVNYFKAIETHCAGTGEWFLRGARFQEWKDKPDSFLWLHGMSGCGKTILSAAIIANLLSERARPTIYFYFDSSDPNKQDYKDMLRSLLLQLYHQSPIAQAIIQYCYKFTKRLHGVSIILDALDAAQSVKEIVKWCQSIHSAEALKVNTLVTSQTQAVAWPCEKDVVPLYLRSLKKDIKFYIRRRLDSAEFQHWDSQNMPRHEVEATIGRKARGLFRWAALQMDTLQKCRNRPAIEQTLRNMPQTLNDTYARMLDSIQTTPYCREVTIILQMLVWCHQPLTVEACNDAIIVQSGKQPSFSANDRLFGPRDIINMCCGLVKMIRPKYHFAYLQLAHASVREYLSSEEVIQPFRSDLAETVARSNLLRMCHTHLWCIGRGIGRIKKRDAVLHPDPLAEWVASTWLMHAQHLEAIDFENLTAVIEFLRPAASLFQEYGDYEFIFRSWVNTKSWAWVDRTPYCSLYIAALLGLRHSCAYLVYIFVPHAENDIPALWPNNHDECVYKLVASHVGSGYSHEQLDASLIAASSQGHVGIVQDLLDRGACPGALRSRTRIYAAWHLASMAGHMEVVTLLIDSGALVPQNHRYDLCKALESGNIEAVKRLTVQAVELLRCCLTKICWIGNADGTDFNRVRNSALWGLDDYSAAYGAHPWSGDASPGNPFCSAEYYQS